ncbi:MAG: hypothetical protein ABSB80_13005 [Methanoregula sp.]|jgi:hypothetical protein|uniref:hypothetical protein n=1 Tax=Methanoregula sp. TaxID=2052170 RepID=UPI003D0CCDF7
MPKSKSVTEGSIPLYLLPRAIARQIARIGDSVYRISVKRTHWHHYNISVRTKSLPKELAPARVTRLDGDRDSVTGHRHSTREPGPGCDA